MIMNKKLYCMLLILIVFSVYAICAPFDNNPGLKKYYEKLKAIKFVPYNFGYTLEEIIKFKLEKRFPKTVYEITGGLELSDAKGYAIGEIDILVLNKKTKKVVLIGEAKVWKDLKKALIKARHQLQKLRDAITNNKIKSMYYCPDPKKKFTTAIFKNTKILYETFSSKGGKKYGFDYEIDITPSEVLRLNKALIKYHYQTYKPTQRIKNYIKYVKSFKYALKSDKKTFICCARYDFFKIYPYNKFKIFEDVSYLDKNGKDLGHVKLVIASKQNNKVIHVANVVFGWNNLKNAAKIYNGYLRTFMDNLENGTIKSFKIKYPKHARLTLENFNGVFKVDSVSVKGSKRAGFTKELPLTKEDVFYIRLKAAGDI